MFLKASQLKAALVIAPKLDIRSYLNGVRIESGRIVATDGARAVVFKTDQKCPIPFTIPRDALEAILKAKGKEDIVTVENDTLSFNGMVIRFLQVEGRFPDWRRIIPTECSGVAAQFQADFVTDFSKVIKLLTGLKSPYMHIEHGGPSPARITCADPDFIGVMMPYIAKNWKKPSTNWAHEK